MNRIAEDLKSQLKNFFENNNFTISPLNSGASVRKYYQLKFSGPAIFPRKKVILMHFPQDGQDSAEDYLNISSYLKRHQLPVPEVYQINRENGWIFLEAARGEPLDSYLQQTTLQETDILYHRLVEFLLELQSRATYEDHCPAFARSFDFHKYLFEFNFHVREKLIEEYYHYRLSPAEQAVFENFAREISLFLDIQAPIFVHRDFQSSNIFYRNSGRKNPFQLIDFQDARSGNPVYDLVSLLWDSYVDIPDQLREQLVQHCYINHPPVRERFDPEKYQKAIDYTIIQRKLHDAGAFVYTSHTTKNRRYFRYIPQAVAWAMEYMVPHPALHQARDLMIHITGESS